MRPRSGISSSGPGAGPRSSVQNGIACAGKAATIGACARSPLAWSGRTIWRRKSRRKGPGCEGPYLR
jgi:hypothetical protein